MRLLTCLVCAASLSTGCTLFMDPDEYAATLDCASFCADLASTCASSEDDCLSACAQWPSGDAGALRGNSLWCRYSWLDREGADLCPAAVVNATQACHDGPTAGCEALCLFRVRSCAEPDLQSCTSACGSSQTAAALDCALDAAAQQDCGNASLERCSP